MDSRFHVLDSGFYTSVDPENAFQKMGSGFILSWHSGFQKLDSVFQCPVFLNPLAKHFQDIRVYLTGLLVMVIANKQLTWTESFYDEKQENKRVLVCVLRLLKDCSALQFDSFREMAWPLPSSSRVNVSSIYLTGPVV